MGFHHLFRGLPPLKFQNFDQIKKTSTTAQFFSWSSYWEKIIITYLHHTIKIENINFFGISSLILWATPSKIENFDQKLKTSTTTPNFSWCLSWETIIMSSICHTIKIKNINFFGISSLFSWVDTFKNREFRQKIENFHHHSKIFIDRKSVV